MKPEDIKVKRDNMLMELVSGEVKTDSGLVLPVDPEVWQGNTRKAKILSKGPDVDEELEVGMMVVFNKHAGNRVYCDDSSKVYRIVRDDDIYLILED